jgi:hypothetical protein
MTQNWGRRGGGSFFLRQYNKFWYTEYICSVIQLTSWNKNTRLLIPSNSSQPISSIQHEYLNITVSQLWTLGSGLRTLTTEVKLRVANWQNPNTATQSAVCQLARFPSEKQRSQFCLCCPFQLPNQLTQVHETVGTLRHLTHGGFVCEGNGKCSVSLRAVKTIISVCNEWNKFGTKSFSPYGSTAPRGPRPPHFSRLRDHTLDTPQSVGLPWTSDQLVAETSTWQHTTLTRDRHPCLRRDSNPQSQQASGRRPTL